MLQKKKKRLNFRRFNEKAVYLDYTFVLVIGLLHQLIT